MKARRTFYLASLTVILFLTFTTAGFRWNNSERQAQEPVNIEQDRRWSIRSTENRYIPVTTGEWSIFLKRDLWVKQGDEKPITVSFCDLINSPEAYNGKLIHTNASYLTGRHTGVLYDLECVQRNNYVGFKLKCDTSESCREITSKLDQYTKGNIFWGRAELNLIGQFKEKPRSSQDDSKQSRIDMDERFEIEVVQINNIHSITPQTPWPWEVYKEKR